MTVNVTEPWEHERGYRLNADGKSMVWSHPETGYELYVEASVDEEAGEMEYRPSMFDADGEMVVYPDRYESKESALAKIEELAEEHV